LQIAIVPIIGVGSLQDAIAMVKKGFKSTIAQNKNLEAEGLVMKPAVELFNRRSERVISKIKHKDLPRS
jgi:ABC-type sugar transport system substrate-binding protein